MDEYDPSRFCCLNSACANYGQRGHGNLTVTARYGPRRTRNQARTAAVAA